MSENTNNQVQQVLLEASGNSIAPNIVVQLLSSKATIEADGSISINGKTAKEAVTDFLKEKPFLAKSSGIAGSGTPITGLPQPEPIPSDLPPLTKLNLARRQGIK